MESISASDVMEDASASIYALEDSVAQAKRAFSGSWQGYHANVYYRDLESPPAGAHFSQEWGLMERFASLGSVGDWAEYDADWVKQKVRQIAGNPDLSDVKDEADIAVAEFEKEKSNILSIISTENPEGKDKFLLEIEKHLNDLVPLSPFDITQLLSPKGQIMTRDTVTIGQGTQIPPHISIMSDISSIKHSFGICKTAGEISRKAASHIERQSKKIKREQRIGTNIFIGHGGAPLWRELKDFVYERLNLPYDEFNRMPVAGITNQTRLSEMLDAAAIAFIIMTAEDETALGSMQARMNVIHEIGLFQGRLGFTKAIILLEDNCEEFSNIQGLGQIRFPTGNIAACFEEVRRVLERENIIE